MEEYNTMHPHSRLGYVRVNLIPDALTALAVVG
jgi:hypothetical protein